MTRMLAMALIVAACGQRAPPPIAPTAGAAGIANNSSPADEERILNVYNWFDYIDPSIVPEFEKEYGIRLLSADAESSITGHIDFLQVRNGSVHILDYKPDARTNKPLAQLTIYALALSHLTGINLFDIKCAWRVRRRVGSSARSLRTCSCIMRWTCG